MQVLVRFDGRGMVAVLPERPVAPFALVVLLCRAASDELHALSNHVLARVFDQKMNVIRGDHIIEHAKTETLLRLEQPVQVAAPIAPSEKSGILSVSLLNGLNGAKRLNVWNDWNSSPLGCVMCQI
jgi:hypothetical protein